VLGYLKNLHIESITRKETAHILVGDFEGNICRLTAKTVALSHYIIVN
jgi:hypothetical protein